MHNRLGGAQIRYLSEPETQTYVQRLAWQSGISDTKCKDPTGESGPDTQMPDQFYIKRDVKNYDLPQENI
jgi:hypothetical protein